MSTDQQRLAGRAGIVTGASRGLGRATALLLAARGADVVACGRDEAALAETASLADGLPGRVLAQRCDVTHEPDVVAAVERCERELGPLRYVVANAGHQVERRLHETTNDDWAAVEAVNARGVFWCCKHAIGAMLEHRLGGSIVVVASAVSLTADPNLAAYTSSKHAALGIVRAVATDRGYAAAGIRANAVCPGDMETPMVRQYLDSHDDPELARREIESAYPVERIAAPEEVAAVIAFLVSDDASFMTGAPVAVDGGILSTLYTHG
jgi:NAD(P)-dependent dehydrogenase (short-subunit alcohol dehydrogenase family)